MKNIKVDRDIIPVGEFKLGLSKWFKTVQETGQPLIITQNGRPAGVLLSPAEFDELMNTKEFVESVRRGIADADEGLVYSTNAMRKELEK